MDVYGCEETMEGCGLEQWKVWSVWAGHLPGVVPQLLHTEVAVDELGTLVITCQKQQ